MKHFFTSESVAVGHPDKVCDTVADAVLDAIISQDPNSRVACEVSVCTDYMLIMGEVTTTANVDVEKIARETVRKIGYDKEGIGFCADTVKIDVRLNKQSPDIALGVDNSQEAKNGGDEFDKHGAGDQGLMFGYACMKRKNLCHFL